MRSLAVAIAVVLCAPVAASANHLGTGLPDCISSVPVAAAASANLGRLTVHGFGGGSIGTLDLSIVNDVVPGTVSEGDSVGALVVFNMPGVLGGGTTTVTPFNGSPVTSTGAQLTSVQAFTGHYKVAPRTYQCESVVRPNTIITYSYSEFTLSGLLTPASLGSPLKDGAIGYKIAVAAGNNANG